MNASSDLILICNLIIDRAGIHKTQPFRSDMLTALYGILFLGQHLRVSDLPLNPGSLGQGGTYGYVDVTPGGVMTNIVSLR